MSVVQRVLNVHSELQLKFLLRVIYDLIQSEMKYVAESGGFEPPIELLIL